MLAVPLIPPGLPSALLERRPDIAAAERDMAAANAQIGVAVAAFYPDLTLSGDYGVAAAMLRKLFTASSRVWSFGVGPRPDDLRRRRSQRPGRGTQGGLRRRPSPTTGRPC